MEKIDYILKQLSKTNKKNYENYVVTRIWNKLDNTDIKFITQQYISRPDGSYALTDMYFPQLDIHIEIDEEHHSRKIKEDELREKDIINVTNHQILRVDVTKGLEEIHKEIDDIIKKISNRIKELEAKFIPWDLKKELDPRTYIEKGYIDVKDSVAFKKSVDACNCFGCNYQAWQKGATKHPIEKDKEIWFPKLYPNGEWDNNISSDENIITEKNVHSNKVAEHIKRVIEKRRHKRIVFARVKSPLGDIMYRFKGLFELNIEKTQIRNCLIWEKTSDMVKTYEPIKES